jgi:hypothetical protein
MGDLLTASATVLCPHGGTVMAIPSNSRVRMGGDPIVLSSDTFVVAGCAFAPGAPHPCVLVEWQLPAGRSTADSTAPLTTDSIGMCKAADGAVQGVAQIVATETRAVSL